MINNNRTHSRDKIHSGRVSQDLRVFKINLDKARVEVLGIFSRNSKKCLVLMENRDKVVFKLKDRIS